MKNERLAVCKFCRYGDPAGNLIRCVTGMYHHPDTECPEGTLERDA